MTLVQLCGLCLLAAAMVMVLRQMNPQAAALLCAAFSILVVGMLLKPVSEYIMQIRNFFESLAMAEQYMKVMLRAMGIVLVTQLASQICKDMDAPSIARRAEFCGRLALLGVAMPIFLSLTQMAVEALE